MSLKSSKKSSKGIQSTRLEVSSLRVIASRSNRPKLRRAQWPQRGTVAPMHRQPRHAASMAATSIFFFCIIASNALLATAGSAP